MALLAATVKGSILGDTHVEGDVNLLSNWFYRDQRTANLAGAIIGAGAQVTVSMPAAESPAIQRTKERAAREIALINGAHELLTLIRNPDISTSTPKFERKKTKLINLMKQTQETTPRKYYKKSDNLVPQILTTVDYVESLDQDFPELANERIYYRKAGYNTIEAQAKFETPGMSRLLFFIWSLKNTGPTQKHSCAIL